MSETPPETPPVETPPPDDSVDIEPIIRNIIREETATTNERLTKLEEALGPLGELGDTIEGLFKKHKPNATKIDEDSLVEKIAAKLTGGTPAGESGSNGGEGTGTRKRQPGPLSRFLGIS